MKYKKISPSILKLSTLAMASTLLFACDLKDKVKGVGNKGGNAIAKATKSCEGYKTENQADGENQVVRTGLDYKFNLYWVGTDSKLNIQEANVLNDNYSFNFDPLTLHVLDGNNVEQEKVLCTENKDNVAKCIKRFEKVLSMIKDARESYAQRNIALSEGKAFTFKCAGAYSEKKLTELKKL